MCCDYFSNYFKEDGVALGEFLKLVKEGTDEKREERLAYARGSVVNSDGTCGEKTHREIMSRVLM